MSLSMNFAAAILYAYTPEVFPAPFRTSAGGALSCFGRISGIVAPFMCVASYLSQGCRLTLLLCRAAPFVSLRLISSDIAHASIIEQCGKQRYSLPRRRSILCLCLGHFVSVSASFSFNLRSLSVVSRIDQSRPEEDRHTRRICSQAQQFGLVFGIVVKLASCKIMPGHKIAITCGSDIL